MVAIGKKKVFIKITYTILKSFIFVVIIEVIFCV